MSVNRGGAKLGQMYTYVLFSLGKLLSLQSPVQPFRAVSLVTADQGHIYETIACLP